MLLVRKMGLNSYQEMVQDGVHKCNVDGNILGLVAFVAAFRALARIVEVHDNVDQFVAENSKRILT
jgi:hypothetical protein